MSHGERPEGRGAPLATHNVVAGFIGRDKAEEAVGALEESGIPRDEIAVGSRSDEVQLMQAEMRQEVDESVAGPAISVSNKEMVRGASFWTAVGTAAGAVAGLVVGVLISGAAAILISVIVFAIAGATVGFLAGGSVKPRDVEQARDAVHEARVTVSVHSENQGHVEQAGSVLQGAGAIQIDRFDSEGNPVPELRGRSGYETRPSKTGRPIEAE